MSKQDTSTKDVHLSVRISPELRARLETLAGERGLSKVARHFIESGLTAVESMPAATAGRGVSHARQ